MQRHLLQDGRRGFLPSRFPCAPSPFRPSSLSVASSSTFSTHHHHRTPFLSSFRFLSSSINPFFSFSHPPPQQQALPSSSSSSSTSFLRLPSAHASGRCRPYGTAAGRIKGLSKGALKKRAIPPADPQRQKRTKAKAAARDKVLRKRDNSKALAAAPSSTAARKARKEEEEEEEEDEGMLPKGNLPVVALVGLPNVGKSTLFNRLAQQNKSLISRVAGTTRDRVYGTAVINGRRLMLVDTGGMLGEEDYFSSKVHEQALVAVQEADIILFMYDYKKGLTDKDFAIARLLRKSNQQSASSQQKEKQVIVIANKADSEESRWYTELKSRQLSEEEMDQYLAASQSKEEWVKQQQEIARLGFPHVVGLSAYHGGGLVALEDALVEVLDTHFPEEPDEEFEEDENAEEEEEEAVSLEEENDESEGEEEESDNEEEEEEEEEDEEKEKNYFLEESDDFDYVQAKEDDVEFSQPDSDTFSEDLLDNDEPTTEETEDAHEEHEEQPRKRQPRIKISIVGKPNVGKSSFLNRILGKERVIVSPQAGTTHDAIDHFILWKGKKKHKKTKNKIQQHEEEEQEPKNVPTPIALVDTAGIRRRGHHKKGLERSTVLWSVKAINRSDVTLMLIDATEGISEQDKKIAEYILNSHSSVVVVVNKWDMVKKSVKKEYEKYVRETLNFLYYVPVVFTSAKNGVQVRETIDKAIQVHNERQTFIKTHALIKCLQSAMLRHKLPSKGGRKLKIKFATQAKCRNPTFTFFVNDVELVHFSYQRFLEHVIRDRFPFSGTPMRLIFKDTQNRKLQF